MSRDYVWSKGDTKPAVKGTAKDENGAIDLSGSEVKFYMRNEETGKMKVDGAVATITDAANGKVEYSWQQGDTDEVGLFEVWFVATYSDGEITIPNAGNKPIEITERGK